MSQEKKLFAVPMLMILSGGSADELYDPIAKAQSILVKAGFGLLQDEAISPKEIEPDTEPSSLRDVMSDVELVGHKPRVVIQLDDDGGSPEVRASTEIEIAVVRTGRDLQDYDEENVFHIPDPVIALSSYPVAAGRDAADVHPVWVHRVFNTIDERNGRG